MKTKIYLETITNTPKETQILGYNLGKKLINQKKKKHSQRKTKQNNHFITRLFGLWKNYLY
ncbi:hypothetical protein [Mulberry dwarf phytoplasma]|uniref:hypothetical protein n=1 Tax=Mulberry dwarf phytoplasma TaxID=186171 RepID=UPI001D1042BE|nr:hypothetical protein [Mulberry dwarf phytoplasma]